MLPCTNLAMCRCCLVPKLPCADVALCQSCHVPMLPCAKVAMCRCCLVPILPCAEKARCDLQPSQRGDLDRDIEVQWWTWHGLLELWGGSVGMLPCDPLSCADVALWPIVLCRCCLVTYCLVPKLPCDHSHATLALCHYCHATLAFYQYCHATQALCQYCHATLALCQCCHERDLQGHRSWGCQHTSFGGSIQTQECGVPSVEDAIFQRAIEQSLSEVPGSTVGGDKMCVTLSYPYIYALS